MAEITDTVDRTITVNGAEPLMLFGFNDVYLRKIESAFSDTRVVARGDQLKLRGPESQVDRIERVVGELVMILNRNGNLTENDVDTVLDLARVGTGLRRSAGQDAILFTPAGGTIQAKTPGQTRLVEAARQSDIVFAVGPAGTGKTYTAVALAVGALKSRQVKKIVLTRPAVEAGESLGFLPGGFKDKVDPYLRPLYDALEDMIEREKLQSYLERNIVEIVPLAYMRGRTLNSAFVILDEAQNATAGQMKMFLTRLGAGSRAIVTGDASQTDLPSRTQSGLVRAREILDGVDGIDFIDFGKEDVVRHKLVKDIIEAYERAGND
nr:PhoH family protein [Rubrivirga marina]